MKLWKSITQQCKWEAWSQFHLVKLSLENTHSQREERGRSYSLIIESFKKNISPPPFFWGKWEVAIQLCSLPPFHGYFLRMFCYHEAERVFSACQCPFLYLLPGTYWVKAAKNADRCLLPSMQRGSNFPVQLPGRQSWHHIHSWQQCLRLQV